MINLLAMSSSSSAATKEMHKTFRACPLSANNYAPTLYSLQDIRSEFLKVLKIHGDRLSAEEIATWLGLEEDDVTTIGDTFCNEIADQKSDCEDKDEIICKVYNPAKKKHQYALVKSLQKEIEEYIKWQSGDALECVVPKQSSSLLLDRIAQEMELTSEDVTKLSHGIDTSLAAHINDHRYLENNVLSSLSGVVTPTSLEKIFDEDLVLVIPIARTLCQEGRLPGSVSASSNNAVYIPDIFTHIQRNIIDSFFRTNGYVTEKKCVGAGLSRNKMESFVRESFPNAVVLPHAIIEPEVICQPLEAAIQSAVMNDGCADLRSLIPLDVASNNDDLKQVTNSCLVDSLKFQPATFDAFVKGTKIVNTDIAIFFSHEMINKSVEMLDAAIEGYSKQRAKEIVENKIGTGAVEKKGKPDAPTPTADVIISLLDVANFIGNNYPDLKKLQQDFEDGSKCDVQHLSWISDRCDGPLIEFCRAALYRDAEHKCSRAVRAEVASLESARHGVSVSDRTVGAAKQMDIQDEFENSFKDLCHILQILAKTIESFKSKDLCSSVEINSMKRELLSGTGSCLCRLITEYCLYRNNVEGGLTFASSHQIPAYVSALDFPSFSLHCNSAEGGKQKNPLQHLRESLQGSSGLNLVRMWNICSDDNDGDDCLEQFISHLEESCLTLVGIPFAVLDKKAEKKLLASRRQDLIDRLEKSSQHDDEILSICVILIYQQTKNMMITGKTMTSLVMNLFAQEKKIPTRVTEVLLDLKSGNASPEVLNLAKQFGAAKNSKTLAAIASA